MSYRVDTKALQWQMDFLCRERPSHGRPAVRRRGNATIVSNLEKTRPAATTASSTSRCRRRGAVERGGIPFTVAPAERPQETDGMIVSMQNTNGR